MTSLPDISNKRIDFISDDAEISISVLNGFGAIETFKSFSSIPTAHGSQLAKQTTSRFGSPASTVNILLMN